MAVIDSSLTSQLKNGARNSLTMKPLNWPSTIFFHEQEKLKPPQSDGPAPAAEVPKPPGTAQPETKPEKPFIAGGSRTTSKGSLLNPEAGSSMASTVLDIVSRKTSASAASATSAASVLSADAASNRKTSSSSGNLNGLNQMRQFWQNS